MLEESQPRPDSSVNDWIKKPSPRVVQKSQEEPRPLENEYDMDCDDGNSANNVSRSCRFSFLKRHLCSIKKAEIPIMLRFVQFKERSRCI